MSICKLKIKENNLFICKICIKIIENLHPFFNSLSILIINKIVMIEIKVIVNRIGRSHGGKFRASKIQFFSS